MRQYFTHLTAHGVSLGFVLFENKTKIGKLMLQIIQCNMVRRIRMIQNILCSAYFRFKTEIGKFGFGSGSHVRIFRPKNSLFLAPFFARPLCSHKCMSMS